MALNFPTTVDVQAKFRDAYELIDVVGDLVTLRLRGDDGSYTDVATIKAKVSQLRPQDIIAGSSAQVGDLRAVLRATSIPAGMRRMERKDRVLWRGREYAVVEYDDATASIGTEVFGVNIFIRG